ncbi:hypothetical protein HHI36_014362 [Cryptolaemus montrouzieri]|uniref:Uncharacterized protein n=1 Tax=Cryptolaemus montrouzieri TaxID=559131 RepID=A0ABD2N329_9CUCU
MQTARKSVYFRIVTSGELCSGEIHRKSRDDEDVNDPCKLGRKISPKKKNEKVTNRVNFDINNLPVVIVPDNTNVSGEVSGQDLSECHVMMEEATVHSPVLPANVEPVDINYEQTVMIKPIIIEDTNDLPLPIVSLLLVKDKAEHGDLISARKRCSKGCSENKNWTENNTMAFNVVITQKFQKKVIPKWSVTPALAMEYNLVITQKFLKKESGWSVTPAIAQLNVGFKITRFPVYPDF